MFEQSFVEPSADNGARRGWTALLSFTLQAMCLTSLVLMPMLYTQALPRLFHELLPPVAYSRPPAPEHRARTNPSEHSEIVNGRLQPPRVIPRQIAILNEIDALPAVGSTRFGVPGGTGDPGNPGDLGVPGAPLGPAMPAPPPSIPRHPVVISQGVAQGYLVRRVQPRYPPLALAARIEGSVVLMAVISREGTIENLRVASGHPMLAGAAIDAVRQWRYRPYLLNGEPVEVETQITVVFTVSRS